MKYLVSFVFAGALIFSGAGAVFAHGGPAVYSEIETIPGMMRYVEDQAVGTEAHEEMEELMEHLFAGELTEAEANRMAELMREYPGPHAMMMSRYGGTGTGGFWGMGMHRLGGGYGFGFLGWLSTLIWLAVGVLALYWFVRKISEASGK